MSNEVSNVEFDDIADRLSPEATDLFVSMVEAHLGSTELRREFHVLKMGRGPQLLFPANRAFRGRAIDTASLNDLRDYGLLRPVRWAKGSDVYDISSDAIRFYRWLQTRRGQGVDAVEDSTRKLVDSAAFVAKHPAASRHLEEAFDLLASDSIADEVVSALGLHLRGALQEMAAGLDPGGDPEQVKARLEAWSANVAQARSAVAFGALADACMRMTQRLTHIRNEKASGEPPATWDEMRRAAFLVAVCAHELATIT